MRRFSYVLEVLNFSRHSKRRRFTGCGNVEAPYAGRLSTFLFLLFLTTCWVSCANVEKKQVAEGSDTLGTYKQKQDTLFRYQSAEVSIILNDFAQYYGVKVYNPYHWRGGAITGMFLKKDSLKINIDLIASAEKWTDSIRLENDTIFLLPYNRGGKHKR